MKIELHFADILLIAFVILKITKVIDWNWFWVLSPLWISILLGLAILSIPLFKVILLRWGIIK